MRKYLLFIVLLFSLSNCATPRERLTRIIDNHPELQRDSVVVLNDTLITSNVVTKTIFTIEDLVLLENLNNSSVSDNLEVEKADYKKGITLIAGNARASIVPTDSGFILMAEQISDTTVFERKHSVPVFLTEAKEKPLSPIKGFLIGMGILFITIIVVTMILRLLKK